MENNVFFFVKQKGIEPSIQFWHVIYDSNSCKIFFDQLSIGIIDRSMPMPHLPPPLSVNNRLYNKNMTNHHKKYKIYLYKIFRLNIIWHDLAWICVLLRCEGETLKNQSFIKLTVMLCGQVRDNDKGPPNVDYLNI